MLKHSVEALFKIPCWMCNESRDREHVFVLFNENEIQTSFAVFTAQKRKNA